MAAYFVLGMVLGVVYFRSLWWTVNRGLRAANPAAWFATTTLLRMALLLGCFRLVLDAGWRRAAACACGVLLGRVVITRIVLATSGRRHAPQP
jgi:F1F0 ATPase subunit 2